MEEEVMELKKESEEVSKAEEIPVKARGTCEKQQTGEQGWGRLESLLRAKKACQKEVVMKRRFSEIPKADGYCEENECCRMQRQRPEVEG